MPRKSKEQRHAELHALALEQFQLIWDAQREDRQRALEARRFVNIPGAQWEWDINNDFQNKIKLEIDHVSSAIARIKAEHRRNQISAEFLPKDGSDADALCDALAGRYRADTQDARGKEARDMAFDCAVEGGLGGIRLRAEYDGKETQRICLEPINDPESSLFFDLNSKRKDKSDAEYAFYIEPWTKEAFEAAYGTDYASWPNGYQFTASRYDWFDTVNNIVRVAEYFVKEDYKRTWRVFSDPAKISDDERYDAKELDEDDVAEILARGFVEGEAETEKVQRIVKYVMNGAAILEGPEVIPGNCIPLVPQYGVRTVINYVERFRGHVIKARDAQIVYNMQVSKVAEAAAASGVRIPIFIGEQVAPYVNEWNEAHINNPAFLRIAALTDANGNPMPTGPVGYFEPPDVAPVVDKLILLSKQDIADQLGNPENAEQMTPDISGVALAEVNSRVDMLSYGYLDNAADAEKRIAEVWLGMAAEIYVEQGRKLKVMQDDGRLGSIEIGKPILDAKTGNVTPEVDFSKADVEVKVDVGPTSQSRRNAIVRTLMGILGVTTDPAEQAMLGHVLRMNIEGEGLSDIRAYSRKKLVAMGVIQPTKEEEAEMQAAAAQPAPPDPQAELANALAQEAEAKAAKAIADAQLAEARAEEARANAAETLAGIPIERQKAALEAARVIMGAGNA